MEIRCLTYNVKDDAAGRRHLIVEVLQSAEPDVVVLQEVGRAETAAELAGALGFFYAFAGGNSRRHLALLSRFPIVRQESYHPWPPIHTTLLDTSVEYRPGQRLDVRGVHLLPFSFFALEWWRLQEVKTILRYLGDAHARPGLLAGDFNAIAPGDTVAVQRWETFFRFVLLLQGRRIYRWALARVLAAGFVDCYRALHPQTEGFTMPAGEPYSRLDYIFAHGGLAEKLAACDALREPASLLDAASDHYPVLAVFDLE
jgi:exonuclease III